MPQTDQPDQSDQPGQLDQSGTRKPTLDLSRSQQITKPVTGTSHAPAPGTETVESFAKRIRTRWPNSYPGISDGKLVNDWLGKYPQYKEKFRPGELYKANLSANWDETKKQLGKAWTAVTGLPKVAENAIEHPFSAAGPAAVLGKGLYEFGAGPIRELAGRPQPGASVLSAPRSLDERLTGAMDIVLGGDPGSARMNMRAGRNAEAASDMFVIPIVTLLTGELTKALPGLSKEAEVAGATRKSNAALMTLMGNDISRLPPAELAERTAQLGQIWKQAAREEGVTDENIKKLLPSRHVLVKQTEYLDAVTKGNQKALDIAQRAVDISHKPVNALVSVYGDRPSGSITSRVSMALRRHAEDTVDPGVKNALNQIADKVDNVDTIGKLNAIKVHANEESAKLFGKNTGDRINSAAQTVYAYKVAGDTIREEMYPALQEMSGNKIDLIPLGKRESDAINLRDGMEDIYRQVQRDQASKDQLTFLQYVFGEGHENSLFSRHMKRRAAEKVHLVPGPTGMLNATARTATGKLGEGAVGEKVATGMVRRKMLPPIGGGPGPGPNTFHFEIPTGLPEEVVSPITTKDRLRYEGTRDLPALGHDPYDPNSFQDTEFRSEGGPGGRESGSTGSQPYRPLENKARRQQIGSAANTVPDRTFSGPATRKETRWQRIVESEGGEVSRQGGGQLRTSDLKTAQVTLDRLQEYYRNHPSEQRQLQPVIDSLSQQIAAYRAGNVPPMAVRVTPGTPGKVKPASGRSRVNRALGRTMGIGGSVGAEERAQETDRKSLPPLLPSPPR